MIVIRARPLAAIWVSLVSELVGRSAFSFPTSLVVGALL